MLLLKSVKFTGWSLGQPLANVYAAAHAPLRARAIDIAADEEPDNASSRYVTHLQHYAYRLAVRPGFSAIHSGQKLLLMYILDAFVSVEGNRLHWIRTHQSEIRAECYQG